MKKNMRAIVIAVVISGIILALAGCGGGSSASTGGTTATPVTIRLASDLAEDAPKSVALKQFSQDVSDASGGAINVEIYNNNALGPESQYTDALVNGSVEMASISTAFASRYHPFAAVDCPYLFSTWDEVRTALSSDYCQSLFDGMVEQNGIRFLAFTPIGFRAFASTAPVESLADIKGLKCRAPNISVYLKMIENMGANPVVYNLSELYPALEQKACDSLELPVGTISTSKFYEVAKYVVDTKHMCTIPILAVNEAYWKTLSAEHQQIITEAAAKLQENDINNYMEYEANVFKEMADNGAIVSVPSEAFRRELEESQAGIEDVIEQDHPGSKAVIAEIRALLGK